MFETLFRPQFSTEPEELRLLKERLANVTCNCNICQHSRALSLTQPSDPCVEYTKITKDIETQSEGYISEDSKPIFANNIIKNALCPTCCVTLNLLREGVVRVLKDEECSVSMCTTDEFTDKGIMAKERTTALKSIDTMSPESSLTLCGFPTDTSSDVTIRNTNRNRHIKRKRCGSEKVTFQEPCSEYLTKPHFVHDCVCLQDFVDSIRPPMNFPLQY